MRGKIIACPIDANDRTVDMTVEVYLDDNTLVETDIVPIPIDNFSRSLANKRVKELLYQVTAKRADLPYSQAQVDAEILNMITEI
jgi:hypothetical protein